MSTPSFDSTIIDGVDVICCPGCGHEFTHHRSVEIWARPEDSPTGLHITVDGVDSDPKMEVVTSLRGNPSTRRNAVAITFSCENCLDLSKLTISQRKGLEIVSFHKCGELNLHKEN